MTIKLFLLNTLLLIARSVIAVPAAVGLMFLYELYFGDGCARVNTFLLSLAFASFYCLLVEALNLYIAKKEAAQKCAN